MTRLALVGFGKIAPAHRDAFGALGAEITACSARSQTTRDSAERSGLRPYESASEMMRQERPDGVLVCPSFAGNFSVASEVIPFGVPVLLEKPPGTSLAELETLSQLSATHRTPVMVAFNRRHYSVVSRAIADAGGPDAITAVFVEWSEDPEHVLKRYSPGEVGRWMFGNSIHGLDLLTTLAGPVDQPAIQTRNLGAPFRWLMTLQGQSQRGVLVSFTSTWDAPGRWRLSFCRPGRRYVFAPLESCTVIERSGERVIEASEEDRKLKPGFLSQARTFLEVIQTRTVPPAFDLASARPAMALAEQLTASLQTGT